MDRLCEHLALLRDFAALRGEICGTTAAAFECMAHAMLQKRKFALEQIPEVD